VRLLAEQVGLPASSVNYIAFAGGGAALRAVLGGQLSAAVSGYANSPDRSQPASCACWRVVACTRPRHRLPHASRLGHCARLGKLARDRGATGPLDRGTSALTERITRLAASERGRRRSRKTAGMICSSPVSRCGKFLLAEQSRIDAVLRRLAATETAGTSRPSR
jgi:putative tricarboxylic transport membrane protein